VNQAYGQIIEWLNVVWRRRWRVLVVAWAVCLVGWAIVVSKPDIYTSKTRIFVDTAGILKPLLQGLAVEQDVQTELEVIKQTLTTRTNLEKVARTADLDILATTPAQMQRLLDGLRSRTTVTTDGRSLLSISYSDTDPIRARDVVQALSQVFIETNLGASREDIENAQSFLDRQIAQYEQALQEAEQRLARFKEEKLSTLPDQQNYQFQISELRSELDEAAAALQRERVRREQLREQLARGPASDSAAQILEAEQELTELLTRYTEQHPQVQALRRKIKALKEAEAAEQAKTGAAPREEGRIERAISLQDYEQLKLKLAEVEANLAVYDDKAARLRARLSRLQAQAAKVPDVEVELARLNRDYDVLKLKHSELLSRREQARMSREREVGSQRIQYEILDPPRIPALPDGPSRNILISAVLVVGIGGGVAFAIALSFLNTAFVDPARLQQSFGIAVLGTVSLMQSARRQTWQVTKLASFAASAGLLFGVYGMVLLAETRVGWKNIISDRTIEDLMNHVLVLKDML